MLLLLLIILTSVSGFAATWYATAWPDLDGPGNLWASVLVAFGGALLWWRFIEDLERKYLAGQFDAVRRKLWLGGLLMGPIETRLVKLWLELESRRADEATQEVAKAKALGLDAFARVWSRAVTTRLEGRPDHALLAFRAGHEMTDGVSRAELLCEAALLLLQAGALHKGLPPTDADVRTAVDYATRADALLAADATGAGGEDPTRREYVHALHRVVRGLLSLAHGRATDAAERLQQVAHRAKQGRSLRSRRVAQLAEVELLRATRRLHGHDAYVAAVARLEQTVVLPGLRQRLAEIDRVEQAAEAATAGAPGVPHGTAATAGAAAASPPPAPVAGVPGDAEPPAPAAMDVIRVEDVIGEAVQLAHADAAASPARARRVPGPPGPPGAPREQLAIDFTLPDVPPAAE